MKTSHDLKPPVFFLDDETVARAVAACERQQQFESVLAARSTVLPTALTPAEVDAFFADGYLVIGQMSSSEELQAIREIYDNLFEVQAGRAEGWYSQVTAHAELEDRVVYPKIHQVFRLAPELCATGFMRNASSIARQLFGESVDFLGGRAMTKPPFSHAETPWHQDQAYHHPDVIYSNVNVWLALQDSPIESGAMQIARGSHLGSVVYEHRRPAGDINNHGLELADLSHVRDAVPCPLPAGGATLHHSYMLHHTGANQTDTPRRALIAVFGLPPQRRPGPLRFSWHDVLVAPSEPGT